MDDNERQSYEDQIKERDEKIEELMEQLNDAIGLLQEIRNMTRGV
jgi:hypothetical protein